MGWTDFLFDAVFNDDVDLVREAIANGADVNALRGDIIGDEQSALYWAASSGRLEIAKVLLKAGAVVDAEPSGGDTALHAAVEHHHPAMVDLLLEHAGPYALNRFDSLGRTPLMIAAAEFDLPITEKLLAAGADVNACCEERDGNNALCEAVERGEPEMVRLLLAHHANPTAPGRSGITALMRALERKRGNGLTVRALIEEAAGVKPERR